MLLPLLVPLLLATALPAQQAAADSWQIRGRVLEADGSPAAGLVVRIGGDRGYSMPGNRGRAFWWESWNPPASATTNSAGRFDLPLDPDAHFLISERDLVCLLPGREVVLGDVGKSPSLPAPIELGDLRLPERTELEIRILRHDGEAAAGIESIWSDGSTVQRSVAIADETGLLRLPTVRHPAELRLRLGDWIYGHALLEGQWSNPLVLPALPEAEFRILDKQDQPAAGLEGYFAFDGFDGPKDLSGIFRVGPDGRVALPDFHAMAAGGRTPPKWKLGITRELPPHLFPALAVDFRK